MTKAYDMNFAMVTGIIGNEKVEVLTSEKGITYTRFQLISERPSRSYVKKTYINVYAFGSIADRLGYLKKGDSIGIMGKLDTGTYISKKTNEKVYTQHIVVERIFPYNKEGAFQVDRLTDKELEAKQIDDKYSKFIDTIEGGAERYE